MRHFVAYDEISIFKSIDSEGVKVEWELPPHTMISKHTSLTVSVKWSLYIISKYIPSHEQAIA